MRRGAARRRGVDSDASLGDMVVGSTATCHAQILALAKEVECREIGIVTVTYRFRDRLESYRLLAQVFEREQSCNALKLNEVPLAGLL